jgi:catechol 2,3-dioxygenase-like lactoylglutathione lyase family enzyme
MPQLMGFSHIDLTVSDCERAAVWWQSVLGFTLVHQGRNDTFEVKSLVHPSGLAVTVMTHDGTAKNDAFDERRVGLDHLGFRVSDRDELRRWVTHLDANGVSHTGIIDTGFGPTVVFRDPDNMQLELYVHQSFDKLPLSDADSAEARQVLTGT